MPCHCGVPLQLEELQSRLLDVGSAVATPIPTSSEARLQRAAFNPSHTPKLEAWIDEMSEELPPLTQFILPSGALRSSAAWIMLQSKQACHPRSSVWVRAGLAAPGHWHAC